MQILARQTVIIVIVPVHHFYIQCLLKGGAKKVDHDFILVAFRVREIQVYEINSWFSFHQYPFIPRIFLSKREIFNIVSYHYRCSSSFLKLLIGFWHFPIVPVLFLPYSVFFVLRAQMNKDLHDGEENSANVIASVFFFNFLQYSAKMHLQFNFSGFFFFLVLS